MATATVRLKPHTHKALKEIAETTGVSIQDALEKAVDERERQVYLESLNASYAALRLDPKAWAEFQNELSEWDGTLNDGLEGL